MTLPRLSSTTDPPRTDSFILRVGLGQEGWIVSDSATTRYGLGETVEEALIDWLHALQELTEIRKPGMPVLAEVEWAREVLDVAT